MHVFLSSVKNDCLSCTTLKLCRELPCQAFPCTISGDGANKSLSFFKPQNYMLSTPRNCVLWHKVLLLGERCVVGPM